MVHRFGVKISKALHKQMVVIGFAVADCGRRGG